MGAANCWLQRVCLVWCSGHLHSAVLLRQPGASRQGGQRARAASLPTAAGAEGEVVYERPSPPPGAGEKPAETVLSDLGLAGTVARLARERQAGQAAAAAKFDAEVQQVMEARQAGTAGTVGTAAVEGAAEAAEELPAPAPAVPATGACSSRSSSRHPYSSLNCLRPCQPQATTPEHKLSNLRLLQASWTCRP